MMHYLTLDLLARKGVEALLPSPSKKVTPPMAPAPNDTPSSAAAPFLPRDDESAESLSGELGQCLACDDIGALGTHCVHCEDSGMIYDRVESANDSVSFDADEGDCPSCGERGKVGTRCIACNDPQAIYLNFHAGL